VAVSRKVIPFTTDATGVASATQNLDAGFPPVAVILLSSGVTADDTLTAGMRPSIGFSDGTTSRAIGISNQDNVNPSNTARANSAAGLVFVNDAGSAVTKRATVSFSSNDVVLTWATNDATAYRCVALVLGGSDVADAAVLTEDLTATGNLVFDTAGFTPTLAFFMTSGQTSETQSALASLCFGVTDGTNQWSVIAQGSDNTNPTTEGTGLATDSVIVGVSLATNTVTTKAAFSSFDADGVTLNSSLFASARRIYALVLNVTDVAVGVETKDTGAAPVTDSITAPAFRPAAALVAVAAPNTAVGVVNNSRLGFGVTDFTTEAAIAFQATERSAGQASITDSYQASAKVAVKVNNSTPAIDAQADATQTANGIDLTWTTNDAVATLIPWVLFGPGVDEPDPVAAAAAAVGFGGGKAVVATVEDYVEPEDPPASVTPLYIGSGRKSFGILYMGRN
jgi:hypothetical protein